MGRKHKSSFSLETVNKKDQIEMGKYAFYYYIEDLEWSKIEKKIPKIIKRCLRSYKMNPPDKKQLIEMMQKYTLNEYGSIISREKIQDFTEIPLVSDTGRNGQTFYKYGDYVACFYYEDGIRFASVKNIANEAWRKCTGFQDPEEIKNDILFFNENEEDVIEKFIYLLNMYENVPIAVNTICPFASSIVSACEKKWTKKRVKEILNEFANYSEPASFYMRKKELERKCMSARSFLDIYNVLYRSDAHDCFINIEKNLNHLPETISEVSKYSIEKDEKGYFIKFPYYELKGDDLDTVKINFHKREFYVEDGEYVKLYMIDNDVSALKQGKQLNFDVFKNNAVSGWGFFELDKDPKSEEYPVSIPV